jgi:hypothetical protein
MTGGQVAALLFAILLLFPGACFLYVGIGLMGESHRRVAAGQMLIVGIVILALIGFLGRLPQAPTASRHGSNVLVSGFVGPLA